MIQNMPISFKVLIILFSIYQFCFPTDIVTPQADYVEKIFEPIPSTIINLEDLSGMNNKSKTAISQLNIQIQTFMTIKHPTLDIVYVAALQGGLFVINLKSQMQVQIFQMNCKKVFLRNDRLYVSRGKEGYSIYQIDSSTGLINLICDTLIGSSVDSIYVDKSGQYLYIGSEGYVYLIQVSGLGKKAADYQVILHVGIYSGETNYIYSARDEKYLMVANLSNGISIVNISQKDKPYLVTQKLPKWQVVDLRVISNGQYVYAVEEWYGLFIADFSQLYLSETQFKANDKIWVYHVDFQTITRAIEVSADENFLFVGLRSIGVEIFDISTPEKKMNPKLIQKVQMDGLANHIFLFNSDNSFLYANGCCISIFNQVEANYNTDIPNVFNTHISRSFEYWSQNTWPWDYNYSNNSENLFLASAYEGVQVYQLQKSPFLQPKKIFASNIYPSTSTDTVALIEEKNLLIQGSSEKGIILWDIKNLNQIKKVAEFNHPLANSDSDGIIYNKKLDCLAIANGYQGAYLLDIKDIQNMRIISEINIIDYDLQATAETVQMTQDAQYLILSLRYHGVLIFNMKYLKSPNLINNFHTYGGEKCLLSYDENYIYISDSFKGLTIINFIDKENAFIESNLNLGSQVQYGFQSLINPNILYLSLIENGQLAMVDLTDKKKPYILAKVQYNQERSIALREAPNKQFITYLTSDGLRIQSIKFSLKIHTQTRKIIKQPLSQNKYTYVNLNPKQPVKVGENIEFYFSSIEFESTIKIQQVFYYRDYEISQIESWMQFQSSKNILRMTIDKDALINVNGCNIILLQILKKLNQDSFIEPLYQILQDQSKQIYSKLKERAILLDDDFLNMNNFFINSKFFIDLDNPSQYNKIEETQDYIKQVILDSIYYQPIKFNVVSSLHLNIFYTQQNEKPIQTLSQNVKIIITILDDSAKQASKSQISSYFVDNSMGLSAQINLSYDFKTVTIEGSTIDVNQVLMDGLQVVFHQELSSVKIIITLIDNINFELVNNYTANQLSFLLNAKQQDGTNSLQYQFYDQINEELTVKKDYTFTFSPNTFQYQLPQKNNLDFQAFVKFSESDYVNVNNLDWIDFDASKRQFKWNGGLSQLSNRYTVIVNATTINASYYWVQDEFEIYFERMPVEIIVIICLTSFTFTLIIILLYCYRSKIQHIRYFDKYTYQSEPAFVNKTFSKIIILIPNYLGEFHKLWDRFIKNERKENNNTKINFKKYLTQQKEIDVSLLLEKLIKIYESNKHFYSKLKEQEFKLANTRLSFLIKGAFARLMLKEDLATFEVYLQLKSMAKKKGFRKDWYKYYTKIIYPEKGNEKQPIPTIEESNSHSNFDSYPISQMDLTFPIIFIDENKICFTLEEANSNCNQKNEAFNHYLLFENIKAEGYGYVCKNIKRQESSYGETLHVSPTNIKKIVAFRKCDDDSKFSCFPKIRSKYLLDFKEIQNIKNSNLPEWLKCDISQQTITFSGKPVSSDVGDILIRIYDNNNYILNQFFINVRKIRKLTYQNGDPEINQYIQQQQIMNMQQLLVPQQSKVSSQFQGFTPSKIFSSSGSATLNGMNLFVQQSPNQILQQINSPHPSSTQITMQNSGNKRAQRNHRNNTQRYTIKQYKQILNGENPMMRFKSDNHIKDQSLNTENYKKNSDEIVLSKTAQSPLQEDSLLKNGDQINNQDKLMMSNYNSSHQLQQQTLENQPEIRVLREETIFSKQAIQQIWSKDQINNSKNNPHQPFFKSSKQVVEEDIIQEEQYASQKDHNKSISSIMYNRSNKHKNSTHLNETISSASLYRNPNDDNSELEKSLGIASYEKIDINSPKLTQFKPRSIRQLNIIKVNSSENLK